MNRGLSLMEAGHGTCRAVFINCNYNIMTDLTNTEKEVPDVQANPAGGNDPHRDAERAKQEAAGVETTPGTAETAPEQVETPDTTVESTPEPETAEDVETAPADEDGAPQA